MVSAKVNHTSSVARKVGLKPLDRLLDVGGADDAVAADVKPRWVQLGTEFDGGDVLESAPASRRSGSSG